MTDDVAYQVRRVRADDWPEQRRLWLEALKDSPMAFVAQYDDHAAQPDEFWQSRARNSAAGTTIATFVAEAGDRFIGTATCLVEGEDDTDSPSSGAGTTGHVVGVYVTPQWRGTGVAADLMAAAIDWCQREARVDRIRLFVMETNERAAAFYRRIGFVETGNTMNYPPDPSYLEREMEYRPAH